MLRSAFRGKPVGSLRPRSSGIKLMRIRCASRLMRSAARASCVLRNVPKSKLMAGPAMFGLRRITAGGIMARFARLERASCCGMHSEGNPSGPFVLGLRGLKLMKIKCASRVLDGVYLGGAFGASRLMTVAAAVPFGIAAVLLWVKYERCVNDSVDGGVFR